MLVAPDVTVIFVAMLDHWRGTDVRGGMARGSAGLPPPFPDGSRSAGLVARSSLRHGGAHGDDQLVWRAEREAPRAAAGLAAGAGLGSSGAGAAGRLTPVAGLNGSRTSVGWAAIS